jgi:phosphatidylglycerophosphatase A
LKSPADAAAYRPPPRLVLTTWEHFIAFGFGAGLAPRAPGTFGTLVGLPLWLLLAPLPLAAYALLTAALFVFGCWVCDRSARMLGVHDYGGIVFDEIVGFLVTCLPLEWTLSASSALAWLPAAFVLFRVFDIWKPWPIAWADRHVRGGTGIMFDDLLAGIYAAAGLEILLIALHR